MAFSTDDFNKIWASTSPLTPYEFSDDNYKQGWNFVGATPPSRQMWDFLQKNNDEKMQYLANNYLPLSGGTMSGAIHFSGANNRSFGFDLTDNNTNMDIGWNCENRDGAGFGLRSTDDTGGTPGSFSIYARDGSNSTSLNGYPDGRLTWGDKKIERVNASSLAQNSGYIRYESGLQMCWGYVSVNVNSTTDTTPFAYRGVVTITFPVAFNGTPFGVSNVDDGSPWWTTTAREITSTTMQVEASGNKSATKGVCWFAVGNWK